VWLLPHLIKSGFRDHGALLKIHGLQQKAIQYDIGKSADSVAGLVAKVQTTNIAEPCMPTIGVNPSR
jgi:hypothetical protein